MTSGPPAGQTLHLMQLAKPESKGSSSSDATEPAACQQLLRQIRTMM
jgi:hypothetical protein